jgi:hypothetical protein
LIKPYSIPPLCSWEALPDDALRPAAAVTAAFTERGASSFQQAGRLLQTLPYGRIASGNDPLCVLTEGRGTCSTKHALLAHLAEEQGLPIQLTLGIYEMCESNTPGVGAVLNTLDLPFILEAHCYLSFEACRIDVTRELSTPADPIERLLHEERITPDQIGSYKQALHQRVLREWIAEQSHGYSFERLWEIREACIAALSQ